jgi:hypothetical protein
VFLYLLYGERGEEREVMPSPDNKRNRSLSEVVALIMDETHKHLNDSAYWCTVFVSVLPFANTRNSMAHFSELLILTNSVR